MTVADASSTQSEIRLLCRYQRNVVLGGGLLLSVVLILCAGLVILADVQDYIAEGRAIYVTNKALIAQEIQEKKMAIRRNVANSEMVWKNSGLDRRLGDSRLGIFFPRTSPDVVLQRLLGNVKSENASQYLSPYLSLSNALAYSLTAYAHQSDGFLASYFVDPRHSFIAIASQSSRPVALNNRASEDVSKLIERLVPDVGDMTDPVHRSLVYESRRVFWKILTPDFLTGEVMLQVAAPAFENKRPFAIMASNFSFDILHKWLRKSSYGGNFILVDQSGDLILSSWERAAVDPELTINVLRSGIWKEKLDSSNYVYRDGMFTFSELLADTGWVLAYSHSWKTILAARGGPLLAYITGSCLLLGLLWMLLYCYLKKILNPLLLQSQRVFDSEQLSRTIISTVPNGFCLISERTGKVVLQNELMRSYDNEEDPLSKRLLNLNHQRRLHHGPDVSAGASLSQELAVTTTANNHRHLLVNLTNTDYLNEEFLLCSCLDITERKELEQGLLQARAAAESANHAKSTFLATMGHEIRTPLSGILGNLELLAYTSMTELQMDRLRTITHSSESLLDITDDILDFSKIESGQMQLEKIPFDIVDMIEQALSIFFPKADEKGLDVYYKISPKLPRWQIGDPKRLRQIVVNLLSNAVKFTVYGKVCVDLDLVTGTDDGRRKMLLRVSDTGIGIPLERRDELFFPFEQGDVSIARHYGGTGLGLSLCHRLTQLMGGSIALESVVGRGTTFSITLPTEDGSSAEQATTEIVGAEIGVLCEVPEWQSHLLQHLQAWGLSVKLVSHPDEWRDANRPLLLFGTSRSWSVSSEDALLARKVRVIDGRESGPRQPLMLDRRILVSCYSLEGLRHAVGMACHSDAVDQSAFPSISLPQHAAGGQGVDGAARILVVEDHPVSRELIAEQLHMLGYLTSLAANAGEALQCYRREQFEMVLTDLSMPDMDGYLLARMLREQGAMLPIIAITANVTQNEHQRCHDAGIDDVLLKPMSIRELGDILCKCLAKSRVIAPEVMQTRKNPALSKKLLQTLRESSVISLREIRLALIHRRRQVVLEQLHAIKGAFAMQHQIDVVKACCDLERLCASKMPEDLNRHLNKLQDLLRKTIKRMAKETRD